MAEQALPDAISIGETAFQRRYEYVTVTGAGKAGQNAKPWLQTCGQAYIRLTVAHAPDAVNKITLTSIAPQ